MATRRRSTDPRRVCRVQIRLTEDERREMDRILDRAGLTASAWVRLLIAQEAETAATRKGKRR